MNDDVCFQPGDKVVRVGYNRGKPAHPQGTPEFGRVYCVADCWWCAKSGTHLVNLVGYEQLYTRSGLPRGWPARCFRKVSEVGHPLIAEQITAQ